ncbi:MAG: naringenin-chalcone synthase, partial [Blastocatellia bacterium]|nr:naringenin-chalcone synthase [Blastocatellia bacterium]
RSLKLKPEQVAFSQEILSNFGNMSSATLPYIWEKIVASNEIPVGTLILSIAFGPGLTAAGAIMRKVSAN